MRMDHLSAVQQKCKANKGRYTLNFDMGICDFFGLIMKPLPILEEILHDVSLEEAKHLPTMKS